MRVLRAAILSCPERVEDLKEVTQVLYIFTIATPEWCLFQR